MGIGKKLLNICSRKAKILGAEKLYISVHPSEETQYFCKSVGCTDAEEINYGIAEHEPESKQMEYVL